MFDRVLAREFYCAFLGFEWQWEHQFAPDLPVYAQVAREGRVLHLSEHHGDATPGAKVMITTSGIRDLQAHLVDKAYRNARPGLEGNDWGLTMTVTDPFGNTVVFWERA
ncbi:glyoxalase superfamily protein [Arsenicicoccus sp. oral taxon 190]|uniref:glyoxalase superfamily protein n=1 Tax=Arsenicicoccus sp. oral taxon 190 TaxID=1658671 RepID=UPI00067A08A8|nr:glyoxalase/bleomycin resistance/extradiol dioxygenase family protein [Arsenicicoccus sp. oral taxon 190]AKT50579.1 bleomycin resistance protein [Arsenicicoccus sp. oral taxon 190]